MRPDAGKIRDGCGALVAATGWTNRHRLPEGGRRRRCCQSHDQKEIPPLQIHAFLPFSRASRATTKVAPTAGYVEERRSVWRGRGPLPQRILLKHKTTVRIVFD